MFCFLVILQTEVVLLSTLVSIDSYPELEVEETDPRMTCCMRAAAAPVTSTAAAADPPLVLPVAAAVA